MCKVIDICNGQPRAATHYKGLNSTSVNDAHNVSYNMSVLHIQRANTINASQMQGVSVFRRKIEKAFVVLGD